MITLSVPLKHTYLGEWLTQIYQLCKRIGGDIAARICRIRSGIFVKSVQNVHTDNYVHNWKYT